MEKMLMVRQLWEKKYTDILLMAGLICIFSLVGIPQGALGECDTDATNYTLCLQNHSTDIGYCACCIVTHSGSISDLCDGSENGCNKPIGIAILQEGTATITLSGDTSHPVIPSSEYFYPNGCNVGILANNLLYGGVKNIQILNVNVDRWANGIMMWRINDGGAVQGSSIRWNGNGIYLFNSGKNAIHTNTIANNAYGMILETNQEPPLGPDKTFNNIVYNNNFFNSNQALFIDERQNQWNVTPISGTNIIGGDYIGGNYWSTPSGDGHSETCTCDSQGFCTIPYNVGGSPNIDQKPLCPQLTLTITPGDPVFWELTPYQLNTFGPAFTLQIEGGGSWDLNLNPTHEGYLYSPTIESKYPSTNGRLLNVMEMGRDGLGWWPVNGFSYSDSGDWTEDYNIRQNVVAGDLAASDYTITLEFVATPSV